MKNGGKNKSVTFTFRFTFMHLADAFIQSDLQLHSGYTFFIQYVCSLGTFIILFNVCIYIYTFFFFFFCTKSAFKSTYV